LASRASTGAAVDQELYRRRESSMRTCSAVLPARCRSTIARIQRPPDAEVEKVADTSVFQCSELGEQLSPADDLVHELRLALGDGADCAASSRRTPRSGCPHPSGPCRSAPLEKREQIASPAVRRSMAVAPSVRSTVAS